MGLRATREERLKRGKYLRYTPELRYEIGTYASEYGLEATSKYFSVKVGQEVTKGLVRRFRKQYGGPRKNNKRRLVGKSGKIYSQALREEIGRYASQHRVEATIQVYSDKLLVAVKPSTVRKFRQLYGDSVPQNLSYIQLSESSSTTIDLLHSSMNVLNQNGGPYIPNYVVQPNSTQPVFLNQQSQYTGFPLSLVMDHHEPEVMSSHDAIVNTSIDNIDRNEQFHSSAGSSEDMLGKSTNSKVENMEEHPKKNNKVEGKAGTKKPSRGRYVQYTPELRAKIGKYALKHGNTAAMKFFQAELGHDIPESTIRGMRDKYQIMSEKNGAGVSEVGCGPRGRPVSLGHHDSLVQEAVKKLQEKGEKVNAFVVIAIAKQVIMQQDPSILQEFGGQVKLNTTWAKSMLRRLGIKNKT